MFYLRRTSPVGKNLAVVTTRNLSNRSNLLRPFSPFFGNWPSVTSSPSRFNDLDNFFNNFVTPFQTTFNNSNLLKLDLKETPEAYEALFDVPGIPKDKVKISTDKQNLTVSVDYQSEKTDADVDAKEKGDSKGEKVHWRERSAGFSTRTITLPDDCDLTKGSAKQENGVLKVTVPKTKEAEQIKKFIDIE